MVKNKVIHTLTGHDKTVRTIAFSPDGNMLASGSWDKSINLYNSDTGDLIRTLKGHDSSVEDLEFTEGGAFLLSASRDGTIRL